MKKPNDLDNFEEWGLWIRKRYLAAKKKKGSVRPALTGKGIRSYLVYKYVRDLEDAGKAKALREFVNDRDGTRWNRSTGGGVDWVLRLLEKSRRKELIDSGERSRLSSSLRCARELNIDPKFIVAFLYEAGSERDFDKLRRRHEVPAWATKYAKEPTPVASKTSN